jgi:serine/threonine protein kinase
MSLANWTTHFQVAGAKKDSAGNTAQHDATPSILGSRIGAYLITKRLGAGGAGEVFKGVDVMLRREVAIKVLRDELASDPLFLERFSNEARLHAKLCHPNVATVHAFLHEGDRQLLVMEFVAGVCLDDFVRCGGPVPIERALGIFRRVLDGIDHAHANGIVHRDIKPGNIMLADNDQVKVMDFGIARAIDSAEHLTRHGQVVGTARAMAPEQIRGEQADARSDIYSLGIVLYTMLAGRAPFDGDDDHALMVAQLRHAPAPLHDSVDNLPPRLEAAVMRALQKDPAARFQSVREFAGAIDACLAELALAKPPPPERLDGATLSRTTINPVVHDAARLPAGAASSRLPLRRWLDLKALRLPRPRWLSAGVDAAAPMLLALVAGGVLLADHSATDVTDATREPPTAAEPAPPVTREAAVVGAIALPESAPAALPAPQPADTAAAVATAAPRTRLTILHRADARTASSDGETTHRFRPGDRIRLRVVASADVHVYCYLQDESQRILRFYPNRFSPSARVRAGQPIEIPGRMRFELVANHKKVPETVACFATEREFAGELPAAVYGSDFATLPVASLDEVGSAFARHAGVAEARFRVAFR